MMTYYASSPEDAQREIQARCQRTGAPTDVVVLSMERVDGGIKMEFVTRGERHALRSQIALARAEAKRGAGVQP